MIRKLSINEQETLLKLGEKGPGGNFDILSLNKLFTLGLVEIDSDRRVVLTEAGQQACAEVAKPH